jgi:hypothetical protein
MIGKIMTGKSFRGCLKYCLNDKLEIEKMDGLAMKNRAEVLLFNQCFGNEMELIRQFNEVRRLNDHVSKPVLHVTLSLAPGEQLTRHQLVDICEACAKEMGFSKNQFVAIHHNDTKHQHLHIVANRIGFDGKTLSDSNNYKKIAAYCRRMEENYNLKRVLSPKKYLSKELREMPRLDERREQLKAHIGRCILTNNSYTEFEQQMKQAGYEVIKSRGIAFRDAQKVYTKGSDVGFSLSKIEKLLQLKPALKQQVFLRQEAESAKDQNKLERYQRAEQSSTWTRDQLRQQNALENNRDINREIGKELSKNIAGAIELLMKHEEQQMNIPKELMDEETRRHKQKIRDRSLER